MAVSVEVAWAGAVYRGPLTCLSGTGPAETAPDKTIARPVCARADPPTGGEGAGTVPALTAEVSRIADTDRSVVGRLIRRHRDRGESSDRSLCAAPSPLSGHRPGRVDMVRPPIRIGSNSGCLAPIQPPLYRYRRCGQGQATDARRPRAPQRPTTNGAPPRPPVGPPTTTLVRARTTRVAPTPESGWTR